MINFDMFHIDPVLFKTSDSFLAKDIISNT